jgi:two-component system, NtrC family, response regulator AtoC
MQSKDRWLYQSKVTKSSQPECTLPSVLETQNVFENVIDSACILVVSREPGVLRPLCSAGESNAWRLETAESVWDAIERMQSGLAPDLLLLDLPRGWADGLNVLPWFRRVRPDLPIIVIACPEEVGQEAIRLGAQDFLVRPLGQKALDSAIKKYLGPISDDVRDTTRNHIDHAAEATSFSASTPLMQMFRARAELLAQADVPVLILGESGSGKDTAAHLIHSLSARCHCGFFKVTCGAGLGTSLEDELFGTDHSPLKPDVGPKTGKLEQYCNGTVLIDEICEMPTSLQVRLLQILQEQYVFSPGSRQEVAVNARILVSTSVNIEKALSERKLREDLYYSLSPFTLHVPPLRQRRDEIPWLLEHFMHRLVKESGLHPRPFSPAVLKACQSYAWPGNLKELESFVERLLTTPERDVALRIEKRSTEKSSDSSAHIQNTEMRNSGMTSETTISRSSSETGSVSGSLKSLVHTVKLEAEQKAIAAALERTGWNRKAAARLLKVSYRTILYKIEQYHMKAPASYSSPLVETTLKMNRSGWNDKGKAS